MFRDAAGRTGARRTGLALIAVAATIAGCAASAGSALAGTWLPAATIDGPSDGAINAFPDIAVGTDGTAVAIWSRFDATLNTNVVSAAVRPPGGTFGPAVPLSDPSQDTSEAQVVIDAAGNATVAWVVGLSGSVQTTTRPAGGTFGSVATISLPGVTSLSLAAGGNGGAVATWSRNNNAGGVTQPYQLEAAVRPPGAAGFDPFRPVSPSGYNVEDPHAAMDAAGDTVFSWVRTNLNGAPRLREVTAKAAGAPFPSTPAATAIPGLTGNQTYYSALAITPGGRATLTWDEDTTLSTTGANSVWMSTRSGPPFAAGAWSTATQVSDGGHDYRHPTLALENSGSPISTWESIGSTANPTPASIAAGVPSTVTPAGLPIVSSNEADLDMAYLAASPSGDATATWTGSVGGDHTIFTSHRAPGGAFAFGTPLVIGTPAVNIRTPSVGVDDQGNAFIEYIQYNNASDQKTLVRVAAYDNGPPSISGISVPGSATAGQQVTFSATASDRVSGATLHWDFGDGGAADGTTVTHTYANAVNATVTLTATDGIGNRTTATAPIAVAAAPVPPPVDNDHDGSPAGQDCNDSDPAIHPGAQEIPGNKVDENCDGVAAPYPRVGASLSASWVFLRGGQTRFTILLVRGVTKGDTVKLSCTGKGCSKRANRTIKATKTPKRGQVNLITYVKTLALSRKAKLTVKVSRPGSVARIYSYTIQGKRTNPKKASKCLNPGATKATTC